MCAGKQVENPVPIWYPKSILRKQRGYDRGLALNAFNIINMTSLVENIFVLV